MTTNGGWVTVGRIEYSMGETSRVGTQGVRLYDVCTGDWQWTQVTATNTWTVKIHGGRDLRPRGEIWLLNKRRRLHLAMSNLV